MLWMLPGLWIIDHLTQLSTRKSVLMLLTLGIRMFP